MSLELLEFCGIGALILAVFALGWLSKLAFEESNEKRIKGLILFAVDVFFLALKEKELADKEKERLNPLDYAHCKVTEINKEQQDFNTLLEEKLDALGKKLQGKTLMGTPQKKKRK